MKTDTKRLRSLVRRVAPIAIDMRRRIHRRPELSNEEHETTDLIESFVRDLGLSPRVRIGRTGLTVDIGESGTMVAFRADIDALPIEERTGLLFSSETPGMMHACGHDGHTAIGLGVLQTLVEYGDLPGRVRFIFQPAEETFPGGAFDLVREGAVEDVAALIAFHMDPTLPPGRIGLKPGPITSSSDRFQIIIEGPGGHTARPHDTVDTVYAAGRVVGDLPALLHRTIDARTPMSIVFGTIHGGRADNVIPTSVEMTGTVRTLDRDLWDAMPSKVEKLVHEIVAPFGARALVHYQRGIPPVVNDAAVLSEVEFAIHEMLGTQAVAETHASLGAEDFARFLDLVPGALMRLGSALPDRRVDLHSASFDFDEEAIEVGILVGAAGLLRLMQCEW
jgi:amidohydrolase